MAGSAGFLSLEVKLDLDGAEAGLKSLAKFAKSELGGAIKIDASGFRETANLLASMEGAYADTLAIVTRMNAASSKLAASTQSIAAATKEGARAEAANLRILQEQEKTRRAELAVQAEQVKAAGKIQAAEGTAAGKMAYLNAQVAAQQQVASEKQKAVDLERQHKALMKETDALIRQGAAEQRNAKAAVANANKQAAAAAKEIAKEEERATKAMKEAAHAAKERSAVMAGLKASVGGLDWGVTAVGAAQARNYGYALGALARMAAVAWKALAALPPQAKAIAIGVIAIVVAVSAAAAALIGLSVSIAKAGAAAAVEMEVLTNQLNAMLPTAEYTRKEVEGIFELGTRTAAPTQVLIDLDKRLLMAGGHAAQMRQQILEGFGAFSSAAGLTTEQMNSLNYVIGEVSLKGRILRTETQQLASAGISVPGLLQKVAEATGKSLAEVNAQLSEGTLNTEAFLLGLTAYFAQFQGSAAAANTSVKILMANIKDQITSGLAQAFYNEGVTAAISRILVVVMNLVAKIKPTFVIIGRAVNNFFSAFAEGAEALSGGTGMSMLQWVFGVAIPFAINFAAAAVRGFMMFLRLLVPVFKLIFQSAVAIVRGFGFIRNGASGAAKGVIIFVGALVTFWSAIRIAIGFAQGFMYTLIAVYRLLTGNFSGAAAAGYSAIGAIAAGFRDAGAAASGFAQAVKDVGKAQGGLTKAPVLKDSGGTVPGGSGGAGSGSGSGKDAKKKGDEASAAASKLAQALNKLWDMTRRWMGQNSEVERSLFGVADEFTASAEQIIDAGIDITKTLNEAGYSGKSKLAKVIKAEVLALAKLARQRDALQAKLEEQQDALKQLEADRAEFATSVSQGLIDFVTSLSTGEETITEWMRLDAVGSFVVTTKKQTKSWVEAQRERMKQMKKFIADIRALKAKGLNPETIKALVEAGPEAAGAAVAELTAGGQDTIDEVNAIQTEMTDLAGEFGEEQAGEYYDAGIAAAKKLIEGTQTALDKITALADALAIKVRDQLAKIAKPAKDAGTDAGDAFVGGVDDSITEGLGGMGFGDLPAWDLPPVTGLELDLSADDYEQMGRDLIEGLWNGITDGVSRFFHGIGNFLFTWIVQPVKDLFGIESPSTLFLGFGKDIIQGLWNGIQGLLTNNSLVTWLTNAFESAKTWLTVTMPNNMKTWAGGIWEKIKENFPDVKGWLETKWGTAKTWLTVTMPNNISTWAGTIWSKLKSGFPNIVSWLQDKWQAGIDWLKGTGRYRGGGLPGAVRNAVSGLIPNINTTKITASVKTALKSGVNAVLNAWNRLSFRFPSFSGDWNGPLPGGKFTIGGWMLNTPNVPLLAKGGMVTAPMMIGAGEAGDEAILPLNNERVMAQIANAITGAGGGGMGQEIRVFIGERELTDIVRVEVNGANSRSAEKLYAGRGS